ncbi:hypothetical protein TWF694_003818 [Orbilia ellipsospora]|uniref:Peptidase M48 domain-containing protein n=1 Tax=Orbilia ellipsospora TaxID=2528407 RepID=A0AAV9X1K4_9PEZI
MLPFFRAAVRLARAPVTRATTRSRLASSLARSRPFDFSKHAKRVYNKSYQRPQPLESAVPLVGRILRLGLLQWASRPTFYFEAGAISATMGAFYLYHLERVPLSNRLRFNIMYPPFEQLIGEMAYDHFKEELEGQILPDDDPRVIQVRRVLETLVKHADLPIECDWEVVVVDSDVANAFVVPGGKIFVNTGILSVCGDDDGIAAVLGHEMAHNVARHVSESMSRDAVLMVTASFLQLFWNVPGRVSERVFRAAMSLPGSRAQESEADRIGLVIMAQSCYDPKAAVRFWRRMQEIEAKDGAVPEIISTHPSSKRREAELEALLPEAHQSAQSSKCHVVGKHVDDFNILALTQYSMARQVSDARDSL